MQIIEINGTRADLGNSEIAISRKAIDINNPELRFADITNQFVLPFGSVNDNIFLGARSIGSASVAFDQIYSVRISDTTLLFSGFGYLAGINKNGYKFQVIDKSKELFKSLDVKLNTVSWDDKDTTLTGTALEALDAADITTCWFWGAVACHQNKYVENTCLTTGDARVKYSRPSFYLQGLLKRAITGYSFTASLPDMAISSNHSDFFFTSYQKVLTGTYNGTITGLDVDDYNKNVTVASGSLNIGTYKTKFRFRGVVSCTGVVKLTVTATDNGTAKTNIQEFSFQSGSVDLTTNEFYSATGITVTFSLSASTVLTSVYLYSLISEKSGLDLSTNPFLDYKIKAHDNLPDVTYLDLFRTFCVLTNSVQNIQDGVFSFRSLANLQKLNAVDWSEKFIQETDQVEGKTDSLAKTNWLKYSNDETVDVAHGRDNFQVEAGYLEDEGDYLTAKFSASYDVTIGANSLASMEVYTDTARQETDLTLRIWQINGALCVFTPLSWRTLKANYEGLFSSLLNTRAVECSFDLNKMDVLNWQSDKLIYVDYYKSLFLVLEIEDFIQGKETKVKLLRYGSR